ncbi:phage tail length tape measure family protein [Brevundimonas sp. DC300-4]|uniref:phage tail length tape measure family protein n=1 Tax=Brevundimonas sp. DC300-4 TaxID=2804594 RepID=UPI003CEB5DC4
MATAEVGALRVTLGLDSGAFADGMKAAQKRLNDMGRSMQRVGQTMAVVGAGMTAAITAPLIAAGFAASKAATEAADAMGQVEAALTSMGGASGRTKEQLAGLASGLMRQSLYDDDDILRKVTANLLTFGNVAGEQFDRAQQAAVDLATRMGTDLQSATLMVGRALNAPVKGLAALGRAGIQFTEAQKATIKSMVAAGNVAGAQSIMLAELERQFGGAAAAAQNTDPYDKIRDSLNDLSESMGAIINNRLKPLLDGVAALADRFNGLSPAAKMFAVAALAVAAALGPALVVVGAVVGALGTLATAFAAGGVLAGLAGFAAAAIPFVAAGAAIAAAIYLFRDDLAPVFAEFRAAAEAALGPALQKIMAAAKEAFAALGPAIKAVVDVVGPILAGLAKLLLIAFGPIILRALQVLAAGVGNAFSIIAAALRIITALFKGDWTEAWNAAGSLVMTMVRGIGNIIEAVFPGIGRVVGRMVEEVKGWLGRKLVEVFDNVIRKVRLVSDAFFQMYDAVVGHSYVPDMVEGVAEWMAKLDAGMVTPAARATDAVKSTFEALRDDVARIMEGLLTDSERAARDLANTVATINRAVADPQQGISRRLGDQLIAGAAGENLTNTPTIRIGEALGHDNLDISKALKDGLQKSQDAFDDTARRFGDQFAYDMERALSGDIRGAFLDMLSDVLRSSLASVGEALFKGLKGGGFSWSSIVSAIPNVFSMGTPSGAPALAAGSKAMGSAALGSPAVSLSEIGKGAGSGNTYNFSGNLMTPEFWNEIQQRDNDTYGRAMTGAPKLTMSQTAQQQQHTVGRKVR